MAIAVTPTPFSGGKSLQDSQALDNAFAYPYISTQDAITAGAGGGQTNAIQLTARINRISVCVTGADSVKLPPSKPGQVIYITNNTANSVQVFAHGTATINDIDGQATGVAQAAASQVMYTSPVAGKWFSYGVGTGGAGNYTGNFDGILGANTPAAATVTDLTASGITKRSAANAITAFATGGQGSATALTKDINSITVCATAADSVKLPAATAGRMVQVSNLGAAYASVFPASGELIDALAANASVSLAVGASIIFTCSVAGSWKATSQGILGAKFTTGTTTTTFAAGQLTGAANVSYASTAGTPGSIATRTATEMFADDPYARVGGGYVLRVSNASSGSATLTITAGVGVTLTGTATVADTTCRTFLVTYTSATALVIQNITSGAI